MPPTGPGRTSNAGRTAFARPRAATLARALAAFLACVPAGASLGAAPSAAQAPADTAGLTLGERLPVVERTLPNGMRLLVLERRGAPTAAFVVQFRVGSVNETLGSTGIAHMLEHMLFKGTTTVGTRNLEAEVALFPRMDALADSIRRLRAPPRPDTVRAARLEARLRALEDSARAWVEPNEFDRILSDHGARGLNASTDYESTSYYVELPSNRLELWFALEADRMRNPVFREFYTERDVVAEERRLRVESQPGGLLYETHMAAAFTMHPYGVPVVGYMPDIRNLTRPQVEAYYRRYYGARSAVVAIVGNVDADEVLALADRYFAELPAGEEPPPLLAVEPPQRGERRVEVHVDAEPMLRMGWRAPELLHDDTPALMVLSSVLTGGRTSRLYRRLITEDGLATSVTSSLGPGALYPGLLSIDVIPRAPAAPEAAEAAVRDEIRRLAREGPSGAEVERIRNQVEAGNVRRLVSNSGIAAQLASSASLFGDWRTTFRLSARFENVTPEDVRRVAERYLRDEALTVAVLRRAPETAADGGGASAPGEPGR